jgi:hypothetical protein
MPTIEIVSLGCTTIPDLPTYSTFTLIAETELSSHRALFQSVFDSSSGVILHLGNKSLETDLATGEIGIWFASDLIDWQQETVIIPEVDLTLGDDQWWGRDQQYAFRFLSMVVPELEQLLTVMLEHSPTHEIYFATDYQFGPSVGMQRMRYTLPSFFDEHAQSGLRWNCLYHIVGSN